MAAHAEAAYPNECCGVLLGRREGETKVAAEARPLENVHASPRAHYLMRPADLVAEAKQAAARGLRLVGVYHSHPDGGPEFSAEDAANAWPWYSFVVVAVRGGRVSGAASWLEARREPLEL